MISLRSKTVASMANGIPISSQPNTMISSIALDSRKVTAGSLFIALSGEHVDGYLFVRDAQKRGATAVMVCEKQVHEVKKMIDTTTCAIIGVDNTLQALQRMAIHHVQAHPHVYKIGITGSCGKTTTKEMLAGILSCMGPTAKTPGNMNSEIGLPVSIFGIDKHTKYGVFEMGIDHIGEMDTMLSIWRPDVALITNIGISHVGKLGSVQTIADEKSKVFHPEVEAAYMPDASNWHAYIQNLRRISPKKFGVSTTEGIESIQSRGLHGWDIVYKGVLFRLKAIGTHNVMDACAAISVAQDLGATPEQIATGLEHFNPIPGRSCVVDGTITIIEDWYNSSIDSTTNILNYVGNLPWKGRKCAVLGSMKELGTATTWAHTVIGNRLLHAHLDRTYLYGEEMESAWNVMKERGKANMAFYTKEYDELQERIMIDTERGDLVLLKGSRVMAMERLIPALSSIA